MAHYGLMNLVGILQLLVWYRPRCQTLWFGLMAAVW
jgi:hypothetical protein